MTCDAYIAQLKTVYSLVGTLSRKNGCLVMRMRHRELGRDVVVRQYEKPVAAYEVLKNVLHDHLPETYDVITCDDGQIVLEEYVDGMTVAQVLENGLYTLSGSKKVLQGVCAAAWTLHRLGVVHRDIKPENVMVTPSGEVKLIDLNASRLVQPEKSCDTQVLGTVGYASPEQLGIAQTDNRADIYAMGILLNVMLTGQHPSKTMAKGKAGRIISRCTHIDPGSRYQTVQQLLDAL